MNNRLPFRGWYRLRYDLYRCVFNPKHWWWYIKNFYERGTRGFGDYDIVGFDGYLMRMLVLALTELKNPMVGTYASRTLPDDSRCFEHPYNEVACVQAQMDWNKYLDGIIADLEYSLDEDYEPVASAKWDTLSEEGRREVVDEWVRLDKERRERGEHAIRRLAPILHYLWT